MLVFLFSILHSSYALCLLYSIQVTGLSLSAGCVSFGGQFPLLCGRLLTSQGGICGQSVLLLSKKNPKQKGLGLYHKEFFLVLPSAVSGFSIFYYGVWSLFLAQGERNGSSFPCTICNCSWLFFNNNLWHLCKEQKQKPAGSCYMVLCLDHLFCLPIYMSLTVPHWFCSWHCSITWSQASFLLHLKWWEWSAYLKS